MSFQADYSGPLTARQVRFVEEYLTDLNGTKAAIRAGYRKTTARIIASQNLKN
jgi:phage terminase small subunit